MIILPCNEKKSKRKKSLILILLLCFIFSQKFTYTVLAEEAIPKAEDSSDTGAEETVDDEEPTDSDNEGEENTIDNEEEETESAARHLPYKTLGGITAPLITAEGAIVMDADNGAILYQKNMDTPYFPASITKIMTCLLAVENCSLSETVTMSNEAVFGIDRTSSNVGLDVGQKISMEEAVLCVMLASANEAASAIAEHVSGSISEFTDLMNERAAELGCTNTHFANANGLPNEDHYISPHDMALIAKAFNDNDTCRRLASMRTYDVAVTPTQPDEIHLLNHHKMYPGLAYAYDPVIWGKTGYTMAAGATLVTVAEDNGMSLICVVMKDESEKNYTDTRTLFDFAFSSYSHLNIAENDDSYIMEEAAFFQTDDTTFGSTKSFVSLDTTGFVVLPEGTPFSRLVSSLRYRENPSDDVLADVIYELDGDYAGECIMSMEDDGVADVPFETILIDSATDKGIRFINIRKLVPYIILSVLSIGLIVLMIHVIKAYNFGNAMNRRMDIKKRRRRYHSDFDDIDF